MMRGFYAIKFSGQTLNPLPIVRFDHIESIYDGARWRLELEHPNWNFWSPLVDGEQRQLFSFDYKFGVEGSDGKGVGGEESQWNRGVILKSFQDASPSDAHVVVLGSDPSLQMKSRSRTQAWIGPFRTTVSKIALDYGLIPDVASADESDSPGVRTHWQYGENDWDFIRRISRKQIAQTSRRGDYEVWVSEGKTLHVRPPGDERPAVRRWSTGELGFGLKRMRFVQRKRALQMQGGVAVQGVAFDLLNKVPLTFVKNYRNFPENTRLGPRVALPDEADTPSVTFRSTADTQAKLEKNATTVLSRRFRHMYTAEIEIFPNFDGYEVGDVITLSLDQAARGGRPNDSVFSGNYLLEQRRTRILGRDIRVSLMASRIGSQKGDRAVEGRQMDRPAVNRTGGRVRQVTRIIS